MVLRSRHSWRAAALLRQLPDGDQQALLGLCAAARRLQQRLSFDAPQLRWTQ
jgi:hypothetical protein